MNNLTIIIADDHPLLLKGLNNFLLEKKYNIVGIAHNGQEAYDLILKKNPDIAILDIQMPIMSGLEVAKKCKINNMVTKVVLITFHKEEILYQKAKELNIFGYILKEFALEEMETCIETVSKGIPYFSQKIKPLLNQNSFNDNSFESLSPSEKKIIKLIAKDKTNKEIASILFISYRTVEKHRSNIINKLKLKQKTNSLLIWAKENKENLY